MDLQQGGVKERGRIVWELFLGEEKTRLEGGRRGYLWAASESELKVSKDT